MYTVRVRVLMLLSFLLMRLSSLPCSVKVMLSGSAYDAVDVPSALCRGQVSRDAGPLCLGCDKVRYESESNSQFDKEVFSRYNPSTTCARANISEGGREEGHGGDTVRHTGRPHAGCSIV